jgi:hypothetical protein
MYTRPVGTSPMLGMPRFEPVHLAYSESCQIYNKMNTGGWWWDTQDLLPAGTTIVPVICASDNTHLTNFLGDKHAWPLCLTIGNIQKDICCTPKSAPGFFLGWSPVCRTVPKILSRHGIPRLEHCCPHSGILTSLALTWHGIVLIHSGDNVILFWLPRLGMIRKQSWLLKSHMAHARCVKFLKVRRWGIQRFDHLITHEINMFTLSFRTKQLSMFCTLLVFIQSTTSSRNTLSAMSIAFGRLMNCISCSWVWLKTYCTGWSNTWKREMSSINFTIDSHQYHHIHASSASLKHSIQWKAAPGREKSSGPWSEHWQWIALQFLTAPRMPGKLQRKKHLMKWWWEQCGHYVNSLDFSANKITQIYPKQH